ncbi:MAG: hypothetical protein ABEI39_02070 [Halobacteriales archaeon]
MTGSDPLARVVADADVLAADLLVGGAARDALDLVRSHSWITLLVSEPLLGDAEAIVATLADERLAADWRSKLETLGEEIDHPEGDQPALATAYRGDARHVLSFDDDLRGAATGAALQPHMDVSVKHPAGFARLFDPESVYRELADGAYPGPDRDPRA